ncbi:hypothetical protein Catovirus_1_591 [Catovirus CTV1]|uniref:Uncharacterized protein n=1 Tax=Catovirus CTV1 TaxID=1977631 RepID=A0A1V0SA24_9VIRU|nr:hypothetical protein Catovirus_1_591 [Catovirus CTV1]
MSLLKTSNSFNIYSCDTDCIYTILRITVDYNDSDNSVFLLFRAMTSNKCKECHKFNKIKMDDKYDRSGKLSSGEYYFYCKYCDTLNIYNERDGNNIKSVKNGDIVIDGYVFSKEIMIKNYANQYEQNKNGLVFGMEISVALNHVLTKETNLDSIIFYPEELNNLKIFFLFK